LQNIALQRQPKRKSWINLQSAKVCGAAGSWLQVGAQSRLSSGG
jgi:hypothetical protein